jgi:hypothetical protein
MPRNNTKTAKCLLALSRSSRRFMTFVVQTLFCSSDAQTGQVSNTYQAQTGRDSAIQQTHLAALSHSRYNLAHGQDAM